MKLILIITILLVASLAEVIPFDNSAVEKIFQQKNAALFLFVGDQAAQASALEAFNAYDLTVTNSALVLSVSTRNDGNGLFERLAEYLGVNINATPQVLYLGAASEKYQFDDDSITAETLANFVERIGRGQIEVFLKSAPIPETNNEAVKVVVGKTFSEYVSNSDKEVLVKFYAPWCGHCKVLAPHFEEAARRLSSNPNVLLVKVDSTENEVAGVDIQGFPTVKFWRKDKSAIPLDFNGERNADGIIQWIKEHSEYEWVEPLGAEEQTATPQSEEL